MRRSLTHEYAAPRNSTLELFLRPRRLAYDIASSLHLWGHLVAIVISGELFGWNIAILSGWGNLAVATLVATVMFFTLLVVIEELTLVIPFADSLDIHGKEVRGPSCFGTTLRDPNLAAPEN